MEVQQWKIKKSHFRIPSHIRNRLPSLMIVSFQYLCTWRHISKLPHSLNVIEGMMLSQQQWPTIIIEWLPCQQCYVWLAFIKAWLKLVNVFHWKLCLKKKIRQPYVFVYHVVHCLQLLYHFGHCLFVELILPANFSYSISTINFCPSSSCNISLSR